MQPLYFTVDSALLEELGEKLVETVHLALAELVKNSFDADATEVKILFENDVSGKPIIKIIDNGIGMSFNAVQDYWMRIATTNKVKKDVSQIYGRPLTGAKGIGRFCCRRLGSHLQLITCGTEHGKKVGRQREIQKTVVDFPWSTFKPGEDVTQIKVNGSQTVVNNEITGTTLIISDLAEEWTTRGLNWLKRQLAVLAANRGTKRPDYTEDPGFNVELSAPDFEGGIRDIREDMINAGWGTLTAYINTKHQAVCELNAMGVGRKTITSKNTYPLLQDIKLKIAIMVDIRTQMRDTSVLSQGSLAKILPEWGGVQVRYRSFRVYPYGDDDWLEIDYDRSLSKGNPNEELHAFALSLRGVDPGRSLLTLLSMRNYVGNVDIGNNATGFEMKLNREGFIASPAVDQLKQFARFAIDWATIVRDYYIRQQTQYELIESKSELEKVVNQKVESGKIINEAVRYINNSIVALTRNLDPKERDVVQQPLLKATDAIIKYNENTKAELLHLKLIASTSSLLLIFSHEVKSLLGVLEDSKNSLRSIVNTISGKGKEKLEEMADQFEDIKERLGELLQLTSLVGIEGRKQKPGNVSLKARVVKVEKVFELITRRYNIHIDHQHIPPNIVIRKVLESEVYSIMLNALSNSIKSVIAGGMNRKISISAEKNDKFNVIKIRDTGIPLDPKRYEEVFVPFISDPDGKFYDNLDKRLNPEDKLIVGTGSGLGLGIINEIVTAHDGAVKFLKPPKPWSNELEICMP